MSPQHWAKEYRIKSGKVAKSITFEDKVVLKWNNKMACLAIQLDKFTNIATMYSAPGYGKYHAFCVEIGFEVN